MRETRLPWRLLLILLTAMLAIPLAAVALVGFEFEGRLEQALRGTMTSGQFAAAVVMILAVDVFLPVPSSLVSTLAGSRLGIVLGAGASWLGMSLGAVVVWGLARAAANSRVGRWLVARSSQTDDWRRLEQLVERRGAAMLIVTRALPVLAEAAVLLAGTLHMPARRFLPSVLLANLGLSLAYACLGHFAYAGDSLAIALVASLVVPIAGTAIVRCIGPRSSSPVQPSSPKSSPVDPPL